MEGLHRDFTGNEWAGMGIGKIIFQFVVGETGVDIIVKISQGIVRIMWNDSLFINTQAQIGVLGNILISTF